MAKGQHRETLRAMRMDDAHEPDLLLVASAKLTGIMNYSRVNETRTYAHIDAGIELKK